MAIDRTIAALADFQRATVTAGAAALGKRSSQGARFLVADEVGLGKTLVARGVIATLLKKHIRRPGHGLFRVVYVCSNSALAQENVDKLAVFQGGERERWMQVPTFSRLAELGMRLPDRPGDGRLLEICSLTPGTSLAFNNGPGNARERFIIWRALSRDSGLRDAAGLEAFCRRDVTSSWASAQRWAEERQLDPKVLVSFSKALSKPATLRSLSAASALELGLRTQTWRVLLRDYLACRSRSETLHRVASALRSGLRELFAESCTASVRANLYVLDEFQRFATLLGDAAQEDQSESQMIARAVLHQRGTKTLLLSATPFKALTHVRDEQVGQAHATQLSELLGYLTHGHRPTIEAFKRLRIELLHQLTNLPPPPLAPRQLPTRIREDLERLLRSYIARSERGILCPDAGEVLANSAPGDLLPLPGEIASFVALEKVGRAVATATKNAADASVMAFHKSVPWSLSFMNGYKLKEHIVKHQKIRGVEDALHAAVDEWIPCSAFNRFRVDLEADPRTRRMQQLLDIAAPRGAEHMLWVPPSLPYYKGEGPFAEHAGFSKTLLFSELLIAPRALSSLVSYECERRLNPKARGGRYFRNRSSEGGWFRFDGASIAPAWSLLYPSQVLADLPVRETATTLAGLRSEMKVKLAPMLEQLASLHGGPVGVRSSRWYALSPFLLDATEDKHRELLKTWLAAKETENWPSMPVSVRAELQKVAEPKSLQLGEPPDDLLDYLADLAIAGPAVCLQRALLGSQTRNEPEAAARCEKDHEEEQRRIANIRCAATTAATAFVRKMNRMESIQVLKSARPDMKPWRALASYGATGNLQAVFDEYIHLLGSTGADAAEIAKTFSTAVQSGSVAVTAQQGLSRRKDNDVRFHCHYAVPLGNQKSSDEKGVARISHLRAAFNSPFWPFLLNSTSIGQEGLDFHWYCRRVVHWNLPANPIDIEQREGRVNRYKSLVVRQRLAQVHACEKPEAGTGDVWTRLFAMAADDRRRANDLVPYWHVPGGDIAIERIVPLMAFSREQARLAEILKVLALYRLAFGQPRQEELLKNLLRRDCSGEEVRMICNRLLVNLAPPMPKKMRGTKIRRLPVAPALRRKKGTTKPKRKLAPRRLRPAR